MAAAGEKAAAQDQTIKAQADQLVELTARVSELTRQMAKIRQLNESAQAASMRRPANSDRVATRRRRSVERAPTISGPRSS
jgi:phage shock protein A